jgi:NodT family efflux transporter outer membrane factor (OMF) lipoprotein
MKKAAVSALFLTLTACLPGPDYHRPAVKAPANWTAPQTRGVAVGAEPSGDLWWKSFRDAELDSLIDRAVVANYDLKVATSRVEEARAAVGVTRSAYFPQIDAHTAAGRNRQVGVGLISAPSGTGAVPFAYETNAFSIDGSLSWEIDLFGRIRRSVEASRDDLGATEQDRRSVLVSLLADVARYYSELRGAQLRLDIANRNIETAGDTLALTKARVAGGQSTERDVAQARSVLESVRSQTPLLVTSIQAAIHRLSVLLGTQPGELENELSERAAMPPVPPDVPSGVPSELLERRPDVRSAEAQLAAATARVGVAKADYFPRITLLGTAGRQATQLHDLSVGLGNYFSVGPSVSAPLFTGGRIRANVEAQNARLRESAAVYQSTVLRAFEETENALVAYSSEQDRRDRLAAEIEADETSFDLANVQYQAGLTDFLTVLDSQRQLFANQDLLAQSQTAVTTNLIALYKALGGGWTVSPNVP